MKKIYNYIPGFYGLLIFIGYINYNSYYRYFDIEISTFLSTGELLLSFLPLTIPILQLFGFLLIYPIIAMVFSMLIKNKNIRDESIQKEVDSDFFLFRDMISVLFGVVKQKKYKSFSEIFSILLGSVSALVGLAFIILFIGYFFLLLTNVISEKKQQLNLQQFSF